MRFDVGFQIVVLPFSFLRGDAVRGILFQAPSIDHGGKVLKGKSPSLANATTTFTAAATARSENGSAATNASQSSVAFGNISQHRSLSFSLLQTLSFEGGDPTELFTSFLLGNVAIVLVVVFFWFSGWTVVRKKNIDSNLSPISEEFDEESESWVSSKLLDKMVSEASSVDIEFIHPHWTSPTIKKVLQDYRINNQRWKPEHFDHFSRELSKGRARLCKDGDLLLRVIDIVVVLVTYEREELAIQEFTHGSYKRGGFEEIPEKTLKTRFQIGENPVSAAARCLCEKLDLDDMDLEDNIRIHPDILNMREEKETNASLPGLTSLPRFYVVEATVISEDPEFLERIGIPDRSLEIGESAYTWESIDTLPRVRKHLRLKSASAIRQNGIRWNMLDHSIVPVLPWSDVELARELSKYGVNALTPFGKPFEHLLKGLAEGRYLLGVVGNTKRLYCVTQEVSVVVYSRKGKVLLMEDDPRRLGTRVAMATKQASKSGKHSTRLVLPSTLKFSNEGTWMAAFRLAQIDFKLSVPTFSMEARVICVYDHLSVSDDTLRREFIVCGPTWPSRS